LVVTRIVRTRPLSWDTPTFVPAALLVILGWPEKPAPVIVIVVVLPAIATPCAPVTRKVTGGVVVFAGRTVPETAVPPSGLDTDSVTAAEPSAPRVQVTASDVALATVAVPQVPSDDAVTTAPVWKPVPVMVNAFDALGVAVTGDTAVIVGAASIANPAGATANALAEPPSVFVTV